MQLLRIIALSIVSSLLLAAQDKPAAPKEEAPEAVVIPIKTLAGDSFGRLVKLLTVFNARFTSDDKLRIIVIYAPKEIVAQMRKVISDLDRPGSEAAIGHNIEMTMSLLKCSTKPAASPSTLPADIEPVAKQLRAATAYKDIQLWDTFPVRLQEGKLADSTSMLPVANPVVPGMMTNMQLRIHPESVVTKSTGRYVRFERLSISLRLPVLTSKTTVNFQEVGINTSGEFKEGQKSVLGKVSGMEEDSAVFVVISLKIVD